MRPAVVLMLCCIFAWVNGDDTALGGADYSLYFKGDVQSSLIVPHVPRFGCRPSVLPLHAFSQTWQLLQLGLYGGVLAGKVGVTPFGDAL